MCGLVGLMGSKAGPGLEVEVRGMAERIRHRGPDGQGFYLDALARLALGHQRLSIIDLSEASHQPMADAATGVVLAYNGEIYNFRELRSLLEATGHVFRSSGDTEVLLRAYLEWGIDCLHRLCGMFAFALWDPRTRVVHLARDATGMKPLYLCTGTGWIAFASELKAFLALDGFQARLDPAGVQQFLEFGFLFELHRTSLRGVSKLEAGERVELADGRLQARQVWYRPPAPDADAERSEAHRIDQLRETLESVVQQHLIADVPLGLLLSGGLDSSVIAALAARHAPITTISMGFDQSSVDERPEARRVAEHVGSRHIDVLISAAEVRHEIQTGAWVFDDLFGDWGTISSRLLYRRCRELGIKVVLVGEGADELFGGYDIFRQPARLDLWRRYRVYQRYSGRRYGRLFPAFNRALCEYLDISKRDPFHAIRLFESRRQLPNRYVMKVDKASMAEGVEARAPYLDRRIADIAYRTPGRLLQANGTNKRLLRAVGLQEGLIPEFTARREKFGAPLAASWMSSDSAFRKFVADLVLAPGSLTRELGYGPAMEAYLVKGAEGARWPGALSIFQDLAWLLLLLESWAPHYLADRQALRPREIHSLA